MAKSNSNPSIDLIGQFKGLVARRSHFILICYAVMLTVGCRSALVMPNPVGPEPFGHQGAGRNGQLLVFSAKEARGDGDDPIYYQHSDYSIYDSKGKPLKYVGNSIGRFDEPPRLVSLPPGRYFVKVRAECYGLIKLPVIIEKGRTTVVHLDKEWQPSELARATQTVSLPGGYVIGWSAPPPAHADEH